MGKSTTYKYAYRVYQSGSVDIQLFGRDTKLSNAQLEEFRLKLNSDGANVKEIALIFQKTGKLVSSSAHA